MDMDKIKTKYDKKTLHHIYNKFKKHRDDSVKFSIGAIVFCMNQLHIKHGGYFCKITAINNKQITIESPQFPYPQTLNSSFFEQIMFLES